LTKRKGRLEGETSEAKALHGFSRKNEKKGAKQQYATTNLPVLKARNKIFGNKKRKRGNVLETVVQTQGPNIRISLGGEKGRNRGEKEDRTEQS